MTTHIFQRRPAGTYTQGRLYTDAALARHETVVQRREYVQAITDGLCIREAQDGLLDELADDSLGIVRPVAILPTDLPNTGRGGLPTCSNLDLARQMVDAIMAGEGPPIPGGDDAGWPPKLLRLAKQHVWLHRGLFLRLPTSVESAWALAHWSMRHHALSLAGIRVALLDRPVIAILVAASRGMDVATVIGSMPLPPEDAPTASDE